MARDSHKGGPRRRRGRGVGPIVRRGTLRVPMDVARRVRAGHPWVYREAAGRVLKERPGDPVEVVDADGEFVGRGIADGESAIAVRVMTRDPGVTIGAHLIAARVSSAIALRRRLIDFDHLQALRLVHGESDGLPGVTVDRYDRFLVCHLYTSAMERYLAPLYDALARELSPLGIYEQRRLKSLGGESPRQPAELVRGQAAPVELEVREGEVSFWVDPTAPLSTGLFPDLRLGRQSVERWSRDRRVLNLFSYTGAISVYAARGGARELVAVDVSAKAHARSRRNFSLNGFDPEKPEHVVGDAFKVLARFAERKRDFDLVVIDPPPFASAASGRGRPFSAIKDYAELVAGALGALAPGGVLVAVSNTRKMSEADFDVALGEGALAAHATVRIVERQGLPVDFPVSPGFPEGNYLKFAVCVRD